MDWFAARNIGDDKAFANLVEMFSWITVGLQYFSLYILMKKIGTQIVAHFNPRGSRRKQAWINPTLECLHTRFSFSGQLFFERKIFSTFSNVEIWSFTSPLAKS